MSRELLMIAVLPTFVIFAVVIKNARAAREPFKKIAKVFGISVASTIVAMILELLGSAVEKAVFESMGRDVNTMLGVFIDCFFIVALVEEGCKYFSFKLMIFHDRAFDNTYDGVIYGAASALGFATLENILYVFQGGFGTGLLRAVLSVPMHACTGILMGYYFGISKYKKYNDIDHDKNPQRRAYVLSIVIHALYDFVLMAEKTKDAPKNFIYITIISIILIMVIVYVLMVIIIKKAKRDDQPIYNRYYYEHLNGAYQDMRGQTSEKMEGSSNMSVMVGAAQQYRQPMNVPYGQPMPPVNMVNQPMYGVPQPGYGRQPNYPPFGMESAFAANRNMPGNNYPDPNRYSAPIRPNTSPYTAAPMQNAAYQGHQPVRNDQAFTAPKVSFCSECGNKLQAGENVCPMCGTRI